MSSGSSLAAGHLRVAAVRGVPLEVALVDPFVIATARLERVRNVAVRVELDDGSVGWGEIGTLHPVTTETFDDALAAVETASAALVGRDPADADGLDEALRQALPDRAASRAGLEEACWDAVARADGVPLWRRFGSEAKPVVTDITIPIGTADRASELATLWASRGFSVLKVKVGGGDLGADLARIGAIASAFPGASLVLDANEGWTASQAIGAVRAARRLGARIGLLEQPVPRDDPDALARVNRDAGVPVAADEACRTKDDVLRIARERLASVVNLKLSKSGVRGTLEMAAAARAAGLGLMIGAMVETRIGCGFAAHLAAGLGGFRVIDLDTPWLLAEDPVEGGTPLDGPTWRVEAVERGHGGTARTA